jgi:putative ABC transport system ATP-binding protein
LRAVRDHPPVLFELRDVSLLRAGRQVLDSVSAEIHEGATAIVGPSGSGKSTLLRLLNRLAEPGTGTISYQERSLADYDPLELRREVSLVPQLPSLLEGTVGSNLRYAAGWPAGARRDALPRPRRPRARLRRARRRKLSVGEQQRAMLARALARSRGCCCSTSRPRRSTTPPATRSRRLSPSCGASCEISLVVVSHDPEQARRLGDWACG